MKTITKSLLVLGVLASALTFSTPATAYSGVFGFGIELNASGAQATNSGLTLYDFTNDSRILPASSSATRSTAWTSNGANPTFNLGTFTTTDTLTLAGGEMLTYEGSGGSVSSATLDYNVVPIGNRSNNFTELGLNLNSTNASGNGNGDRLFALESNTTNLLAGLSPGTYELETFGFANTTDGVQFINGNGNYGASFTVVAAPVGVPEPSVWASMLVGFVTLMGISRFRRLSHL